jgi:predicted ABC-type ATPase
MSRIFMISGPNGAGKTTTAMALMPELLDCNEYVNADAIAAGLSPFKPETTAIQAGRLMLLRIRELAGQKKDFAFETTMASRSFLPFLKQCKSNDYTVHLLFLWLHSPELALKRVASRVLNGGHYVPDEFVQRRYKSGLDNFFKLYIPVANTWLLYDNSSMNPELIAQKATNQSFEIFDKKIWETIQEAIK